MAAIEPGRIVFFDLETSGLDKERHAITQIAAIAVCVITGVVHEEIEIKVLFKVEDADPEALRVNSYSKEVWERDAVHPEQALSQFSAFLKRHATVKMTSKLGRPYRVARLAGHNSATFDGPFLQAWYSRLGQFCPASYLTLDTLQLALWHFSGAVQQFQPENFKLQTLCNHLGIPTEGEAHDALADVKATVALWKFLEGV